MSEPTTEPSVEGAASTATPIPPSEAEPTPSSAVVAGTPRKKGELPWWAAVLVILVAGVIVYFVYQHLTADVVHVLPAKKG